MRPCGPSLAFVGLLGCRAASPAADGTLQPLTVIDAPPAPNWVEPVELPG